MFIFTNQMSTANDAVRNRTFVKSTNVKVFPCGRRRGIKNGTSTSYIPFDPEARLNTELNQRKSVGISGNANTFIQSIDFTNASSTTSYQPSGHATFVLNGYVFTIEADDKSTGIDAAATGPDYLGKAIVKALAEESHVKTGEAARIYANIKLATVPLFEGSADGLQYSSWVLRDQTGSNTNPSTSLDMLKDISSEDATNYYFSGLSFSLVPLAYDRNTPTKVINTYYEYTTDETIELSLCILVKPKNSDTWQINQKVLLPSIRHGATEDSVEISNLAVTDTISQNNRPVVSIELEALNSTKSRLKLYYSN